MLHKHDFSSACGVHLHSRRHIGKGVYYMRVICKGLQVGDEWESWTHRGTLTCTEIISVGDSRGVYPDPADAKDALIEAHFKDSSYREDINYIPLISF